ncbi:MAG: ATP-binding cassette domain-containing protein [Desulfobacteraceae bacterium]|jgi:phospholipid/cholesterol/gamma-HCH transport system ATP-binding protein
MKQPLIQFNNVCKKFDTLQVLRGVSLSISQGEVTTIIGKSGGGKSVLLKHMIGLMIPDAGEIFFNGRPLSKMKRSEINRLWEKFSYVFQDAALFDSMTVYENIAFPLQQRTSLPKADIRERVRDKLHLFELQEIQDKYQSQISGGMKRRVALARALVTDPEVVLLDEPTTGLDPIRTNAVYSMIVDFQKKLGFTAVMISHEIPEIFYFSQRIAMLDEGRIRFEGTPEEILRFPDPAVQQFIQGLERPRDALTGMATPVQAEKKVQEKLAHLRRHQIAFSVVMFTVENLAEINEKMGHVAGQTILKNFADQIKQRLDLTDSCSRYSLDKILVVLHDAEMDEARRFSTRLARELKIQDLRNANTGTEFDIRISAGYAQAKEDSLIKEVLAKAESKDSLYFEFELK